MSIWSNARASPPHVFAHTTVSAANGASANQLLGPAAQQADAALKTYGYVPTLTLRLVPTQSNANAASAVAGGSVDVALGPGNYFAKSLQHGDIKLLGYVGDETPWQLGMIITSAKTADGEPDTVKSFLRAYVKGVHDYYDAFTTPDGQRKDGPSAPTILDIMVKNLNPPREQLEPSVGYQDREARLDVKDVLHQVGWYKAQGLLKADVDLDKLIDKRFVKPLP